jgi:hypothetical protein
MSKPRRCVRDERVRVTHSAATLPPPTEAVNPRRCNWDNHVEAPPPPIPRSQFMHFGVGGNRIQGSESPHTPHGRAIGQRAGNRGAIFWSSRRVRSGLRVLMPPRVGASGCSAHRRAGISRHAAAPAPRPPAPTRSGVFRRSGRALPVRGEESTTAPSRNTKT